MSDAAACAVGIIAEKLLADAPYKSKVKLQSINLVPSTNTNSNSKHWFTTSSVCVFGGGGREGQWWGRGLDACIHLLAGWRWTGGGGGLNMCLHTQHQTALSHRHQATPFPQPPLLPPSP